MEIKLYKNIMIAFDHDYQMVNATDMLKAFPEKKMNNFLRIKQTKDFIKVLESVTLKSVTVIKQGGTAQGTWMHKLLAFKFAAWLSPEFELFVYKSFDDHISEKFRIQQRQLDYFWDKEDQRDTYLRKY